MSQTATAVSTKTAADLKNNADINKKAGEGQKENGEKNKLHQIARNGTIAEARKLLATGYDVNTLDEHNHNALWEACSAIKVEMVEFLIDKGAKAMPNLMMEIDKIKRKGQKVLIMDTPLLGLKILQNRLNNDATPDMVKISWNQIFEKIKSQIKIENSLIMKENTVSLTILADGKIKFELRTFTAEEAMSLMSENSSLKHGQVFDRKTGQAIVHKYKNQMLGCSVSHYRLPPLIFFYSHIEETTFEFIVRNLSFLKSMGYSKFCFEFDYDQNLDSVIENMEGGVLQKDREPNWHKQFVITAAFLKKIKEQKDWLSYHGIDLVLGPLRDVKTVDAVAENASIIKARDACMAEKLAMHTNLAEGGTITILGGGHASFLPKLVKTASNNAFNFQLYHCYNSKNQSAESIRAVLQAELHGGVVEGASVGPLHGFSVKQLDEAGPGGLSAMDKAFQMNIQAQITEPSYESYLGVKEKDETENLKILKSIFKLPFIAGVQADSFAVDALLYVNSITDYKEVEELISSKINLVHPIRINKVLEQHNAKGKYVLIVPDINRALMDIKPGNKNAEKGEPGNAMAIYQVSLNEQPASKLGFVKK